MKNKKFLPLVILVGVVALLGILLAVLTLHGEAETDTTLPLCDLAADDIDALSYAGNNVEVSLLKGSDGWLLADDPSLPLDQTKVQSLVEDYANLKAQRKLEASRVEMMRAYAETDRCRSAFMLGYFGAEVRDRCGICDNCVAGLAPDETAAADVPYAVQATVRHAEFGLGTVTDVEEDRITVLFEDEGYRTLALDLVEERGLLEVT